eukprot:2664036-Pyramimonas_sp.AAC.1
MDTCGRQIAHHDPCRAPLHARRGMQATWPGSQPRKVRTYSWGGVAVHSTLLLLTPPPSSPLQPPVPYPQ